MKVAVIYYSRSGTTKKMAEIISDAVSSKGADVRCVSVEEIQPKEMLDYDGIIIGSPTYYGTMAAEIKKFLDDSVAFHTKLDGKIGGAFSSSANIAGGNETTVVAILEAMLIHGMVIQGDANGDHYGPVAVGKVDSACQEKCVRFGERFADLLKRLGK